MKAIFVSFNQAYYEMILNAMDGTTSGASHTGTKYKDVEVRPASRTMGVTLGRH